VSVFAALYGAVARRRRARFDAPGVRRRLARPVVSVGALTVGGSGKTPVVAALATVLRDRGERPVILSRGYARRRTVDGVVVVSDAAGVRAAVAVSGDEPQMLARQLPGVPVLVCPDRYLAGRLAERRFGATLHLLDDGFQHLRLRRDLDLVCVDPEDLDDRPLPAGRLREAPAAAARADAVFVGADAEGFARLLEQWPLLRERPAFRMARRVTGFADLAGGPAAAPRRPWLLTGIARPERFATDVRLAVGPPLGHSAFPDHHPFSAAELLDTARRAEAAGADAVLTTAKDAMRIAAPPSALAFRVMESGLDLDDESWLRERLAELRRSLLAGAA
jgi:tetraacyldisaccharide 4'-kinase